MSERKKKKHKDGKAKDAKEPGQKKPKHPKKPTASRPPKPAKSPRPAKAGTKNSTTTKRKSKTKPAPVVHVEAISLRAYYISENRRASGIPGDERGDWHEAERQLKKEAAKAEGHRD